MEYLRNIVCSLLSLGYMRFRVLYCGQGFFQAEVVCGQNATFWAAFCHFFGNLMQVELISLSILKTTSTFQVSNKKTKQNMTKMICLQRIDSFEHNVMLLF